MPEVGKLYSYIDQYGERVFCTVVSITEMTAPDGPLFCRLRVEILSEGQLVFTFWAEGEWDDIYQEVA